MAGGSHDAVTYTTHSSHQQSLAMLPASISSAQRTVWGCGTYSFLQFPASAAGWGALTLGRVTELSFTAGSWQKCRDISSPHRDWSQDDSAMTPLTQKIRKLIDCYHLLFMRLFRQVDIFRWGTVDMRGQMLDRNQRRKQTKQQRVRQYTTY